MQQCNGHVCMKLGSVYSLDWTTGLDHWTGLLDSPLTCHETVIVYKALAFAGSMVCATVQQPCVQLWSYRGLALKEIWCVQQCNSHVCNCDHTKPSLEENMVCATENFISLRLYGAFFYWINVCARVARELLVPNKRQFENVANDCTFRSVPIDALK